MRSTTRYLTAVFFLAFSTIISASGLKARQNCGANYSNCSPSGATSTVTPDTGSGLSPLYVDLLNSISGVKKRRHVHLEPEALAPRSSSAEICCADGTTCLLLQNFNVPFCYDKFTTNFFLPDNSYGTIVTGNYTGSDASTANLLSGNYTLSNGTTGNVYGSSDSPSKPNTATLTLPTQYTSAGVGSAIPASALGAAITYTTTVPGTTIEPTTIPAETFSPSVQSATTILSPTAVMTTETIETSIEASTTILGTTVVTTEISYVKTELATTVHGSTQAATTIPGTTISAQVLTVTTHVAAATTTSTAAALAVMIPEFASFFWLTSFLLTFLFEM